MPYVSSKHYALFVSYFPHLIAGPVLHHAEMMPQFALPRIYRPRLENFAVGLAFLLMGLAQKVLLADSWAAWPDELFDSPTTAAVAAGAAWSWSRACRKMTGAANGASSPGFPINVPRVLMVRNDRQQVAEADSPEPCLIQRPCRRRKPPAA